MRSCGAPATDLTRAGSGSAAPWTLRAGRSPVAGLHWVGLPWQTRLNSGIIDGIDRDARQAVKRIAAERAERRHLAPKASLASRPCDQPPATTDGATTPARPPEN